MPEVEKQSAVASEGSGESLEKPGGLSFEVNFFLIFEMDFFLFEVDFLFSFELNFFPFEVNFFLSFEMDIFLLEVVNPV